MANNEQPDPELEARLRREMEQAASAVNPLGSLEDVKKKIEQSRRGKGRQYMADLLRDITGRIRRLRDLSGH